MSFLTYFPILAQTYSPSLAQIGLVGSLFLTIAGAMLHLYRPYHRMSVEERVKDRRITEKTARRQMRFLRYSAPTVTLLGAVLMGLVILDLASRNY